MNTKRVTYVIALLAVWAAIFVGCSKKDQPAPKRVGPPTTVILVYGLGQSATGDGLTLRDLGHELESPTVHVHYMSYKDDVESVIEAVPAGERIVLAGHSLGGEKIILASATCIDKHIDEMILLAPVDHRWWNDGWTLSGNVGDAVCFLPPKSTLPPWESPVIAGPKYENRYRPWGHADFPKKQEVHDSITRAVFAEQP